MNNRMKEIRDEALREAFEQHGGMDVAMEIFADKVIEVCKSTICENIATDEQCDLIVGHINDFFYGKN